MDAYGIPRVAPGAVTDRFLHRFTFQVRYQSGYGSRRQLNGLRNRPFRSIGRCVQRACAWRCDVIALPCLKQHAIANQALQHQPAGGGIQLPEPACLGEREPQSGHLAKLSAHTLNQSFHRHTTFQLRFTDGRSGYRREAFPRQGRFRKFTMRSPWRDDCAASSRDDPDGKTSRNSPVTIDRGKRTSQFL